MTRSQIVHRSAWAVLVANAIYVVALVPDALAGWPAPPIVFTGIAASVSILLGAPAMGLLVIGMARGGPRAAVGTASVAASAYAGIAVINRVIQFVLMSMPASARPKALDLYAPNSAANFAEFFAWDMCLGIACLAGAAAVSREARWPRRLLAGTGAVLLAGEAFYLAGFLGSRAPWVGRAGMMFSAAAWAGGLTAVAISALASPVFREQRLRSTSRSTLEAQPRPTGFPL